MINDTRPIGVFDSGVGGISVLGELVKLMPNENFLFHGDSANAPYGNKPYETVVELTLATARQLVEQSCKCLVIACNTATAAAVNIVRDTYPDIPVIGLEPALKPAVLHSHGGCVLVMATSLTLVEPKFLDLLRRYGSEADIHTLACPGLVEYVERGELESPEFEDFLRGLFAPYMEKRPDSIVLGCTHYPFALTLIRRIFGNDIAVFDGGNGAARETKHQLMLKNIEACADNTGKVIMTNSDPSQIPLSNRLLELIINRI